MGASEDIRARKQNLWYFISGRISHGIWLDIVCPSVSKLEFLADLWQIYLTE